MYVLMNLPKGKNHRVLCSYGVLSRHFILRNLALKQKNSENKNKTRNEKGRGGGEGLRELVLAQDAAFATRGS